MAIPYHPFGEGVWELEWNCQNLRRWLQEQEINTQGRGKYKDVMKVLVYPFDIEG